MKEQKIKKFIMEKSKRIKQSQYSPSSISSLVLYNLFQYSEYFANTYKDKIKLEKYENNEIRVVTGILNNINGEKNGMMKEKISNVSITDFHENNFSTNSVSMLKKEELNELKILYNKIKETKSEDEMKETFKNEVMNNSKMFYIANLFIFEKIENSKIIKNVLKKIENPNKKDNNHYKTHYLFNTTNLFNTSNSRQDIEYYKTELNLFLKKLKKEIMNINQIEDIPMETQIEVNNILDKVYKEYPYLKNKPSNKNIDYYIAESKYGLESKDFSRNNREIKIDNNEFKSILNTKKIDKDIDLIDFIQETNISFDYKKQSLEGMIFTSNSALVELENKKNIYIIARKNNETIGVLSIIKTRKEPKILKIHEICVKSNYRGLNIPKSLYKKLAEFSIKNELIITNSMYTNDGRRSLPKIKEEIKKEYPDFLLLDAAYDNEDENKKIIISNINNNILFKMKELNAVEQDLNFNKIKEIYKKQIKKVESNLFIDYEEFKNELSTIGDYNEEKEKLKRKIKNKY